MTRKISADFIFDGISFHKKSALILEGDTVVGIETKQTSDQHYDGLLMPGFINTHCHLELSHMVNKVSTGTGLLPFLRSVVSMRDVDHNIVLEAIALQDNYMWQNGIQAVGDISNKADTSRVKIESPIEYYTFVEMFDLLQPGFTDQSFDQYEEVYRQFSMDGHRNFSAVPHAPYTVTKGLFEKINGLNSNLRTISIHNQETTHEDDYFLRKSAGFTDFYQAIGIDDSPFEATGKHSIYYAMDHMDPNQKTLFVHNTLTQEKHIHDAHKWSENVFWATCANANLYIENRLPDYQIFLDHDAKMTVGTDSLTSNWQLSILEELKTIQKYNSFIPIEKLLQWATKNGAEALGFDHLGSFENGKKPGVIFLENFDGENLQHSRVKRVL